MRILLLIDRLERGGAETHVITLAEQLLRQGAQITLLSCGGTLEEAARAAGVRILHFPAPLRAAGGWRNIRFLRTLLCRWHFDVIHAHTRRTALLCRLATLCPVPLPSDMIPYTRTYRRRGLLRAMQPLRVVSAHARFSPRGRLVSYWGDVTVAVSEDIRAHLAVRFGRAARRTRVIPNGVDLTRFCPSAPSRDESVFRVVFASRLDADCSDVAALLLEIAPMLALRCAARGKRAELTFLGGGECREALERIAAVISPEAGALRVTFAGGVDDPWRYFQSADVFVGVSRAALEALGCGCAVILAGNEGYGGILRAQDYARHEASNFCCRGMGAPTAAALMAALDELLSCDALQLQQSSEALRALLSQRGSAVRMGEQTMALYREQLSKRRRLRVGLVGYFGRGNLGDEAILRHLTRQFQGAAAPCSLAAATPRSRPLSTASPQELLLPTLSLFVFSAQRRANASEAVGGLPAHARGSLWRRLRAMTQADALLFGGGTLLQNASRHGNLSLLYYLWLAVLARICRCPVSFRASGIGPLRGRWARALTGAVLRQASEISLRDEGSRRLLWACGVPPSKTSVCPDPILGREAEDALQTARRLGALGIGAGAAYLCVVPRPMDAVQLGALFSLVRQRADALPCVVLSLSPHEDAASARDLSLLLGAPLINCSDERVASGILQRARAVISMRLHGLLLSCGGVQRPSLLALSLPSTEPKLSAFTAEHGGEYRALLP